jgi:hypothetical protein
VYLYFILQQYISTGQREFITASTPTHDGCFRHSPPPSFLIQIHLNLLLLSSTLFNSDQTFFSLFLSAFDFSHFVLLETGLTWIQDEGSYPEHRWATSPIINFIQVDYIQFLIQNDKYEWTLICIYVCWFRFYLSWNSFVFLNLIYLRCLISC